MAKIVFYLSNIILLLIFLNSQLTTVKGINCSETHPLYSDFLNFVQYLKNQSSDVIDQINQYQIKESSAESNTFCTATASNSCCTSGFEKTLLDLAYQYYRVQVDKDYFLTKFLDQFYEGLKKCSGNNLIDSPEKANISSLNEPLNTYRLSILKIIKANVQLIRGNLCIMCVGPTSYADYIDQGKIKVQTASIEKYISLIEKELKFLDTLRTTFQTGVLDYYNKVADTSKCGGVLEKANTFLLGYVVCPGGDCKKHAESRVTIFTQAFEEELHNIVLPDFLSTSRRQMEVDSQSQDHKRQLSLTSNYVQGGNFETYRSASVDSDMVYQGARESSKQTDSNILSTSLSFLLLLITVLITLLQ